MRKFLVAILVFLFFGTGLFYFLMYSFKRLPLILYSRILQSGIDSSYLVLDRPSFSLLAGGSLHNILKEQQEKKKGSFWRDFHFDYFLIPMPFRHPVFTAIPSFGTEGRDRSPRLGIQFLEVAQDTNLFEIHLLPIEYFNMFVDDPKFFSIPMIWTHIITKGQDQIWRDLFSMDLLFGCSKDVFIKEGLQQCLAKQKTKLPLSRLAYGLYILYLRQLYFGPGTENLSWVGEDIGLWQRRTSKAGYIEEVLHVRDENRIRRMLIISKIGERNSIEFRERLLAQIKVRPSYPESSNMIYVDYQNLTYNDKVGQTGFLYLFTAWSHITENKQYLKKMIQFLEKGKNNTIRLVPLYQYVSSKFGIHFLKEEGEELEKNDLSSRDFSKDNYLFINREKLNPSEKLKQLLDKAKESSENLDIREDILYVE